MPPSPRLYVLIIRDAQTVVRAQTGSRTPGWFRGAQKRARQGGKRSSVCTLQSVVVVLKVVRGRYRRQDVTSSRDRVPLCALPDSFASLVSQPATARSGGRLFRIQESPLPPPDVTHRHVTAAGAPAAVSLPLVSFPPTQQRRGTSFFRRRETGGGHYARARREAYRPLPAHATHTAGPSRSA